MEIASFPADEAATLDGMVMRVTTVTAFFMVCCTKPAPDTATETSAGLQCATPVGFCNGTLTRADTLTHESMDHHDADGTTLIIQSVTVAPEYRRRGVATHMLRQYILYVRHQRPEISKTLLICKKHLIAFYQSCGFTYEGESPIVHGQDTWHTMSMEDMTAPPMPEGGVDAYVPVGV